MQVNALPEPGTRAYARAVMPLPLLVALVASVIWAFVFFQLGVGNPAGRGALGACASIPPLGVSFVAFARGYRLEAQRKRTNRQ